MEYFQEVIDRATGDLRQHSIGKWVTLTELGRALGVGPRKVRAILTELGFLVSEGQGRNLKLRLAAWVTDRGWGKRNRSRTGTPFDVVGPDARRWIDERWADAVAEHGKLSAQGQTARDHLQAFCDRRVNPDMPVQEQVCWLVDFYPSLSQAEKARIIGVTQQVVSKYEDIRRQQISERTAKRNAILAPKGSPATSAMFCGGYITEAHN